MNPQYHLVISLVLSFIFYSITNSIIGSAACFLVGVFVDLDHFFDFWVIAKKKISFNIREFFDYFYNHDYQKACIPFHAIEFIPVIFILGTMILGKTITYGILLGFISHIIVDYIGNGVNPFTYFLTYRIYKRFDVCCFENGGTGRCQE